ncbi:MAG: hypothetical protein V3V96_16430 [Acidiferrobacterales bacterium]
MTLSDEQLRELRNMFSDTLTVSNRESARQMRDVLTELIALREVVEVLATVVEGVGRTSCTCIPAYKDRGLTDPQCARCELDVTEDEIVAALAAAQARGEGE